MDGTYVILVPVSIVLGKNLPIYEVKEEFQFPRPLFAIIFRPKIVVLDTNSILRVKTMYELVK